MTKPPHPLPYFGSKRRHAPKLAPFINDRTEALYEPFAGSLAFTLYAATHGLAYRFIVGDIHEPLCKIWGGIINDADRTALAYKCIWEADDGTPDYYAKIKDRYNAGREPTDLLWLIMSSKYNSPRFTKTGNYLQGQEQGYKPKHPDRLEQQIQRASYLLKGRTEIRAGDWEKTTGDATKRDFAFLDPPYQGAKQDYQDGISCETLCNGIMQLTKRQVSLAITYDGASAGTAYAPLPDELGLTRAFIVGNTKSGRRPDHKTYIESLYLWPPQKTWHHQVINL